MAETFNWNTDLNPPKAPPMTAQLAGSSDRVVAITADADGNLSVSGGSTVDTNGDAIPNFSSLPQAMTYDAESNLETVTITDGANSWVQTYDYDSNSLLVSVSGWVKS